MGRRPYIRTWSGWVYVAFVPDVYSRIIVGRQLATHVRTDLPLDALEMAFCRRGIKKGLGLIHHSDRGSQPGLNPLRRSAAEGRRDRVRRLHHGQLRKQLDEL
ncbi:DDE-type integrase/transposase/recombinase [Streptomyces sp. NPDC058239]|uniref:DDE-type integrase/transposase/recombinase n=1 Tax=Streptomyces sp. NPDC058239 TaxID=3346395 RepID=UPI0036E776FE